MNISLSEKRWAENEVIFRKANEHVIDEINKVKKLAEEDGQHEFTIDTEKMPVLFYCECANPKCRKRISLTPKDYVKKHRHKSQFILIPGHHFPAIERVIYNGKKYMIVEKYVTPSDKAHKLSPMA
jgi:hypothetical protein